MKINPYLGFNGQCEEAFKFYETALGGKIEMMMKNGESPMANQAPPNRRDHILHATMSVGAQIIQGGDTPEQHFSKPQGFCVSLQIDDPDEANRVFTALSEGATIQMPLQETFWAQRFGMLIDRFSIPWMVNCGK
jgi:PhnB protein